MVAVVVMGSIVDIVQFSWILKRAYNGFKSRLYDKVRKEILLAEYIEEGHRDGLRGEASEAIWAVKASGEKIRRKERKRSAA